ncbi:hypothetical protein SAMN04515674_115109 [Pseudarcicella hirudinis]|uniref:Uncharacterized protein n=1 Tax=Pseudarcicella hirudinis TaxID=1079859 RepID=A0A1I5XQ48_9BACT|nr:hypothetical protein SAMN04515674_115109 [Pseudarcicella hirudinis]
MFYKTKNDRKTATYIYSASPLVLGFTYSLKTRKLPLSLQVKLLTLKSISFANILNLL